MPGLMPTCDQLPDQLQEIVKEMSEAARAVMSEHGFRPMNDDRAAVFDEACAAFLNHSLLHADDERAVRRP